MGISLAIVLVVWLFWSISETRKERKSAGRKGHIGHDIYHGTKAWAGVVVQGISQAPEVIFH